MKARGLVRAAVSLNWAPSTEVEWQLSRREGPQGDTEERDKAGVDRRPFQNCSVTTSPAPLPLRLPARKLAGHSDPPLCQCSGEAGAGWGRDDGHLSVYKLNNREVGSISKRKMRTKSRRPYANRNRETLPGQQRSAWLRFKLPQTVLIPHKRHLRSMQVTAPSWSAR